MIRDDTQQPIEPALLTLLGLFDGPLADVRFPDVDRASLTEHAEQVRACASAVEAAEAALTEARLRLRAAREGLAQHGERALAYARVYAAGPNASAAAVPTAPEPSREGEAPASLLEVLSRITLPRAPAGAETLRKPRGAPEPVAPSGPEPKRRGPRARKRDDEARLFAEAEVAGAEAPAAE